MSPYAPHIIGLDSSTPQLHASERVRARARVNTRAMRQRTPPTTQRAPHVVLSTTEDHTLAGAARSRARVDVAVARAAGARAHAASPHAQCGRGRALATLAHQLVQKQASTTSQSFLCDGYFPAITPARRDGV